MSQYPLCVDWASVSHVRGCRLIAADANLARVLQVAILHALGASWLPEVLSCFVCGSHQNGQLCVLGSGNLVSATNSDITSNWDRVKQMSDFLLRFRFFCLGFSLACFKKNPSTGELVLELPKPSAITYPPASDGSASQGTSSGYPPASDGSASQGGVAQNSSMNTAF